MKLTFLLNLLLLTRVISQDFTEFNKLIDKGDSAYEAKNYALSIKYYESSLRLSENKKPELSGRLFYDMACDYSLLKDKEHALKYLGKSFETSNRKNGRNPVGLNQLATDSDLDFIRSDPAFINLIKRYVPPIYFKKEISYEELFELIKFQFSQLNKNDVFATRIYISNKTIYWKKDGNTFRLNQDPLLYPNLAGLVDKDLVFTDCTFKLNFYWFGHREGQLQEFPYAGLEFENCTFEGEFFVRELKIKSGIAILKSKFNSGLTLLAETGSRGLFMDSCSIKSADISISGEKAMSLTFSNNYSSDSSLVDITAFLADNILIANNHLTGKDLKLWSNNPDALYVSGNYCNNLIIERTRANAEFDFLNNHLGGKFLFHRSSFNPDPNSDIDWKTLTGGKIGILNSWDRGGKALSTDGYIVYDPIVSMKFNTCDSTESTTNERTYSELLGLYSMFLNLYKNRNTIESYNACYIEIKELQSKRLKYLYESNPSFQTYFRWKLSRLLKFYVSHGTDPARAIVISINIIILFGIFFFFFPSDWDTTSKSKLIQNFKDFIQKNEKGYIKPFFILLWGFLVSLLNALTLSLNAFITLGFGNIPTHGIARYVCVLEGFLGWFLLSIFTVALINQVL